MKDYYSRKSNWLPSGSWRLKNCSLGFAFLFLGFFFICFGLWICLLLKIWSIFNNTAGSATSMNVFLFLFSLKTLLWPLSYFSHFEKKSHLVRKILCPIHTSSIYSIKYAITIPAFSKSSFWLYIHSIYQK